MIDRLLASRCSSSTARALATLALAVGLASCVTTKPPSTPIAEGTRATIAVLETADLHSNIRSFDYYKLVEDKSVGFERVATLVNNARREFPNTLLFDNGDTIQGTALSDYQAQVKPVPCEDTLAMYAVMNDLRYDAAGLGNHEFNYGLSFLSQVTNTPFNVNAKAEERPMPKGKCGGPNFPLVLANVYSQKDKKTLYPPYVILDRIARSNRASGEIADTPYKVGVIGFTPPKILDWDKRWLQDVVYTESIKELAEKYVPEVRAKGADIVVVISHAGLDPSPYSPTLENANWHIAQVPGVDALLMGHSHQLFPVAANAPASAVSRFDMPGVDARRGFVHGVPAVMPGFWGKALGVIKLELVAKNGRWTIDREKTAVEARLTQNADRSFVDAAPEVTKRVDSVHQATIDYVKTPIGTSDFSMNSYFVDVGDVSSIQIVNEAQADFVRRYVKDSLPQYTSLPVLSAAAPFKTGFAGANDFTEVAAGKIAINNAADLYLYPNTLYAVKITGAEVKGWLEASARRFRQIDPKLTEPQSLIANVPGYNFDIITSPDLRYEIDVTEPVGQRIKNLTFKNAPLSLTAEFIVATNNYRASGGGSFPGLDGKNTIIASQETNREVLVEYVKQIKTLTRAQHGSERSWRFSKVATAGPITFPSAPGKLDFATAAGLANVSLFKADDGGGKGLALYRIDLGK
jgi:2',3'-cyclic-nucleotide 2'-phosphodiesterase / 3'-nucleotidase